MNNVLSQLKATFGGNPTEGERQILEQVSGAITLSRAERRAVLNNAISIADRRLQASRENLKALGTGEVTGVPAASQSSDYSKMSVDDLLKVDPTNLSEPDAKAYIDRMRELGLAAGN